MLDVFGWIGSSLLMFSYAMVSFGRFFQLNLGQLTVRLGGWKGNGASYLSFNIVASALLTLASLQKEGISPIMLNLSFLIITLLSFSAVLKDGVRGWLGGRLFIGPWGSASTFIVACMSLSAKLLDRITYLLNPRLFAGGWGCVVIGFAAQLLLDPDYPFTWLNFLESCGFMGTYLLLGGYFLFTSGQINDRVFIGINIVGQVSLSGILIETGFYASLVLQAFAFLIGLLGLMSYYWRHCNICETTQ